MGGVVKLEHSGIGNASSTSGSSFTVTSGAILCTASGYVDASTSFYSLYRDTTNSKVIMASINVLNSSATNFTLKQMSGFSGVSFGGQGVMIGSSFYFVGQISSYGSSMAAKSAFLGNTL